MERFMFSTPMIISPVDVEPQIGDVDELIETSVNRELFEPIVEPYEGMEFDSEEAVKEFYNAYATQMGFKARISSFIRSKRDKTIISRQLVCSREGFRSTKDASIEGRTKRPRMITRVGCRAMIMVKKQSSGKWIITKCEKIHNHVLGTQGKVEMLGYDPYSCEEERNGKDKLGGAVGNAQEMLSVLPEGEPGLEPHEGMEFESEQEAQLFYKEYARRVGFRARVSSYYRSKRDNSIISRLIVCSKEGFRAKKDENGEELQRPRAITRVGCKAMIMVKKRDSGKWVVSKLVKHHNHQLKLPASSDDDHSNAEDDDMIGIEKVLGAQDGTGFIEPYEGLEFESEEAAKIFYFAYSRRVGFNMRVSTYYRSKRDRSIISRLFVCSKEGFYTKKDAGSEGKIKRPREATRVGCKAMLMVKKTTSGKWFVSKFEKDHNHPLGSLRKARKLQKHLSNDSKSASQIELHHSSQESLTSRYNKLCQEAMKYAEAGAASPDVYNVAMCALKEAVKKVTAIKKNNGASKLGLVSSGGNENIQQLEYSFPFSQRSRKRKTSPSSQSQLSRKKLPRKLRICNTCKNAAEHTSRNCPKKQLNIVSSGAVHAFSHEPSDELIQQDN
uniref:FAR1 domain-containing protein n=1 Tax=Ananas comosus var. bracteatus TaxID=296719 RepID=A0A6V7QLA6_ANACO|nr:unnamed protein product [Ananas comosus var. bracteatus]